MNTDWVQIVVSILSGLAVVIPVVVKLVEQTQKAIKEKNWNILMLQVIDLMEVAEEKFEKGADRKEWVLGMLEATSKNLHMEIDYEIISDMIDNLCDMSKALNKK